MPLARLANEPHRVFFPLGILASILGVALWPLHFGGILAAWPLEAHARLMVVGFGGCFIVGFLGTAGPRLLGSFPWTTPEVVAHATTSGAIITLLMLGQVPAADTVTGFWLAGVLASLGVRFVFGRKDVPPPGFPIAVLGVVGACIGSFALAIHSVVHLSPLWHSFWRLMLFQGFLWLPILGVAPYLLPRFFGKSSPHSLDESRSIPRGWWRPFFISVIAGLLMIYSFEVEARGLLRPGMWLRAAVVGVSIAFSVPGWLGWGGVNAVGRGLRWVVPCALAGWIAAGWFVPLRIGLLHGMFIGATGLIMIGVATRVVLGHGGRHDRLQSPMKWFHAVWALLLLVAATRITPEFVPKIRISHYIYAASFWTITMLFWAWRLRLEFAKPKPIKLLQPSFGRSGWRLPNLDLRRGA
ncbi:NnrS family protein [Haloferula sargassicola]|uniref:NnrS family protein n=1 Tax=Haloferula sargassicola TaxID=490096 RepID=A0ABP9UN86_9BACT